MTSRLASALLAGALGCSAGAPEIPSASAPLAATPPAPPARRPVLGAVVSALDARNVTRTGERNESNPRFSPDGRQLAYESRDGSAQAIWLARVEDLSAPAQRISSASTEVAGASLEDELLGVAARDDSYNAQLSFLPGGSGFVFTGNGRSGAYRLYRGAFGVRVSTPLTSHSREDGHPAVSPDGRWLAYVSAREGTGKLILRDLESGAERPLTQGSELDLYPAWSPDSRSIAFTSGANDDHNIYLLRDVAAPDAAPIALTQWSFDDLRPVFSPDGSALAFYSSFDPAGEAESWSIVVVPADGSGPRKGVELGQRAVATHVVKDLDVGPAWLPWGRALVYARRLEAEWNPIYVVDADTREERRIETSTRMNHDLICSTAGLLAFRAQVASWDDVFVARLVERGE